METQKRFSQLAGCALAACLALMSAGCGLLISRGPPAGHEQMAYFSCTESDAGPTVDLIWAALNVIGAAVAAADPDAYEDPDQIIVVGLGWGVVSSVSAVSGFRKSSRCRAAKQQLAERQAQGRAAPLGPQPDTAIVQAVVVSPPADTLMVGERVQLVATAHGSSGAVIPGRVFTWSSSNDAIASVGNAGLVSAHAAGAVVIAANTGNVVGTAQIVVVAQR